VLLLEKDFYYVGITQNIENRIKQHFTYDDKAAKWTTYHPPVKIVSIIKLPLEVQHEEALIYENALTIDLMKTYGLHKVRGGDFVRTKPSLNKNILIDYGYDVAGWTGLIENNSELKNKQESLMKDLNEFQHLKKFNHFIPKKPSYSVRIDIANYAKLSMMVFEEPDISVNIAIKNFLREPTFYKVLPIEDYYRYVKLKKQNYNGLKKIANQENIQINDLANWAVRKYINELESSPLLRR